MIFSKTYKEPPFCKKEILRYAGCKENDEDIDVLLGECINEVKKVLVYKVCYREFPVKLADDICNFESFSWRSANLALNLKGCEKAIFFAATLGVGVDRLIAKYGRISPAKALIIQAIGAERIEALCDMFCSDVAGGQALAAKPRFSPGYGDLSLECQKDIFSVLDCERKIGLTLNGSLLMSPSKSVTAVIGLENNQINAVNVI